MRNTLSPVPEDAAAPRHSRSEACLPLDGSQQQLQRGDERRPLSYPAPWSGGEGKVEVKTVDIRMGTYLRPVERRLFWEQEEGLGLGGREEDQVTVVASDFSEEAEMGLREFFLSPFSLLAVEMGKRKWKGGEG
jgi:hypothetical protein